MMSSWFRWFTARNNFWEEQSSSSVPSNSLGNGQHLNEAGRSIAQRGKKRKVLPGKDLLETCLKKQKADEFSRCPICLKKMKDKSELVATPCAHVFCCLCLMTSLEYSKTCPYCRLSLKKKDLIAAERSETSTCQSTEPMENGPAEEETEEEREDEEVEETEVDELVDERWETSLRHESGDLEVGSESEENEDYVEP